MWFRFSCKACSLFYGVCMRQGKILEMLVHSKAIKTGVKRKLLFYTEGMQRKENVSLKVNFVPVPPNRKQERILVFNCVGVI